MKKLFGLGLVLVLALTLPALLAVGGDAEAGKALYAKKCASCHGPDGSGNGKMAEMLKVDLAINTDSVAKMSEEDIKKLLTEGRGKKKPIKGLSDEDMANIVAYVHTLKKM